jgi:hypothetical protein
MEIGATSLALQILADWQICHSITLGSAESKVDLWAIAPLQKKLHTVWKQEEAPSFHATAYGVATRGSSMKVAWLGAW